MKIAYLILLFLFGAGCASQPLTTNSQQATSEQKNSIEQAPEEPGATQLPAAQLPTMQQTTTNYQLPTSVKPTPAPIKKNTASQLPTTNSQQPTNNGQPTTPKPSTYYVSIFDNSYSPQVIAINVGDSIVWTNKGTSNHTSVSTRVWDSSNIFPGTSFMRLFNAPGNYSYSCGVHPNMTGTVIVR